MSDKWVPGQELVNRDGTIGHTWDAWCSNQAQWERNGWRAIPAPPVERELADGWRKVNRDDYECLGFDCPRLAIYMKGELSNWSCAEHAESMGVFASPEPKAEAAKPCADWCGTVSGCGGSSWCRGIGQGVCRCDSPTCRGLTAPPPAPVVEKPRPPRCLAPKCEATPLLRAVRFTRVWVCDTHHLEHEAATGEAQRELDRERATAPKPRPAAHPGTVPQVFGLGVGVWASRGMAVKR